MSVEEVVRKSLESVLSPLTPPGVTSLTIKRTKFRRAVLIGASSAVVLLIAVGAYVLGSSDLLRSGQGEVNAPAIGPSPGPTPSSTEPSKCHGGPWATYCPEADWARSVAAMAGYSVLRDTGSALVIVDGDNSLFFWAFEAEYPEQSEKRLKEGDFSELMRVNGTVVYVSDDRITWDVHGLLAWLDGGPQVGPTPKDAEVIGPIVRASMEIPYP